MLFKNKDKMALILKKWEYLYNKRVFCYNVLPFFIIHHDLSFGGFALKIEFVVFVYELFIYEIIFFITQICKLLHGTKTKGMGTTSTLSQLK